MRPQHNATPRHITPPLTAALTCAALFAPGCGGATSQEPTTVETAQSAPYDRLGRQELNQLAMRLNLALFWQEDTDEDGAPDPSEVRQLMFYPSIPAWTEGDAFTPAFDEAYRAMIRAAAAPEPESERLRLVIEELQSAAPTLVHNDLRGLPDNHRDFARRMLRVAALIDSIYAQQVGMAQLASRADAVDVPSQSVFRRNWGARCRAASTEGNPACSALEGAPQQTVDVYPAGMQSEESFCQALEARDDSESLLSPFSVVSEVDGELVAVPYTTAYAEPMGAISAELRAAADALSDPEEGPLSAYLRAAAQAFTDNDWEPADEAWAAMNARNSRWYVRVGPDEVYWDPCSHKAGFHLSFALINSQSLAWQDALNPLQQEMERSLSALDPDAYEAREVSFQMPDFIDIVVNAGDDRDAFGATIGQSLPNWGAVAEEGRGRTVAMSNLFTDPDSLERGQQIAASLLTAEAMEPYSTSPTPGLLSTILHEANHNLGPSHDFRVDGRTASEAFGGGLYSMLSELKAQTGVLFFLPMLTEREIITAVQEREAYLDSIVWALGHISRGMYTPSGRRKAYSQLAAVQVGFLLDEGVMRYDPEGVAANGRDQGAFSIDFDALPAAGRKLMRLVIHILATQDRAAAEAIAARYVDGDLLPQALIAERYQRFPRASLVFSVDL